MLWIKFAICSVLIVVSGSKLSGYADAISEKTGFSSGFLGLFLLAAITSLPELVTSLSSTSSAVNAPDIAAGDILGAVIINLFVLSIMDLFLANGSIFGTSNNSNTKTLKITMAMLAVLIGALLLRGVSGIPFDLLSLHPASVFIGTFYIFGFYFVYRQESNVKSKNPKKPLGVYLISSFFLAASVIVASGIWLAHIGKEISETYGLGQMSVGLILVAVVTTMPEFTVSYNAARRGSYNLASGNLLGSNMFNIFIISILDISTRGKNILTKISFINVAPAVVAVVLSYLTLRALRRRELRAGNEKHTERMAVMCISALYFLTVILMSSMIKG